MAEDSKTPLLKTAANASFLLLIFSLGFMQPDIYLFGISIVFTEIAFLLTCSIWLFALIKGDLGFRWDRTYFVLGLYAVGLLFSAVFSENPRVGAVKILGEVYLIGLAIMAFNFASDPKMIRKIFVAWLAATAISAFIGTITVGFFYLGQTNWITEFSLLDHYGSLPVGDYPRLQGTFLYPSMLCDYLTVSLMMLLAARKLAWIGPKLFAILAALTIITIIFTVTPGIGSVILAVCVWFYVILKEHRKKTFAKFLLTGGILAQIAFLTISTVTFINISTSPYFFYVGGVRIDPTQRLLAWQGAFQTFLSHPFFGKGIGLGVVSVYFMPPSGQMQVLTDAHNMLLSTAGQAGIFGVIPLILIAVAIIRKRHLFTLGGGPASDISLALGWAFVSAFLLQGLVGSFEDARHLWVLIGLIIAVTADRSPAETLDETTSTT